MDDLNFIISKNIIALRKKHNLTQLELAEKLNYSDKSISKWEKAEAIPSVDVLYKLATLFGVTIDYFVQEEHEEKTTTKPTIIKEKNKAVITLMSVMLVWLVALVVYTVFQTVLNINLWTIFLWSVPASCVLVVVFSLLWSPKRKITYISISLLIWTCVIAGYFQFLSANLWLLFVVAVPLQICVILWAFRNKDIV